MVIWVKRGEVYLEKEEGSVSGVRRGNMIWGNKGDEFLG